MQFRNFVLFHTLFINLFLIIVFISASVYGQNNQIKQKRWNPIRDRYLPRAGLCPQNYNGTKLGEKLFRVYQKDGRCYHIDDKGPCGKNMQFYRIGGSDYGECDCIHTKRCGRPLVYWKLTDSCFYINTQGPCKEGSWLTYGVDQKPMCKRNPCLLEESESPSNHKARRFWTSMNGRCKKTRTQGFCPYPKEVLFYKEGEIYPTCVHPKEATICNSANRISRPCWAGQKFELSGGCREKVGLWGSEDDHGL